MRSTRGIALSVALAALAVPAMAADSGKLKAPPAGGWEAALAAARPAPAPPPAPVAAQQPRTAPVRAEPAPRPPAPEDHVFAAGDSSEDIAVALADEEITDLRGGFAGTNFSMYFAGNIEHFGPGEGHFSATSNGLDVPQPIFGTSNGNVNIQTHIGDFQGASGVFQIAQVPGDFNVVNQNLFVQINLFNGNSLGQFLDF